MQPFFDQLDHVYCLCIPSRKKFVIEQFEKLGIINKATIFDAYTDESLELQEAITDHLIYPIYMNQPKRFACVLGSMAILEDILEKKYNYALVIQDDVLFLENMFEHANKHITRENINQHFNIHEPYIMYLISPPSRNYVKMNGIDRKNKFKYGEPAFILNHRACNEYIKYRYPITCPIDELKQAIEKFRPIQKGILKPYIVGEMSVNNHKLNFKNINHTFKRNMYFKPKENILTLIGKTYYHIKTDSFTFENTVQKINSKIKFKINENSIRPNMMYYCVDNYVEELGNNYLIGATVDPELKIVNKSCYVISVRGELSANIVKKVTNNKPFVCDFASLVPRYFPIELSDPVIKYCLVYKQNPNIISPDVKWINPENVDINKLFKEITEAKIVISDIPDILSASHSYGRNICYAVMDKSNIKTTMMVRDMYNRIDIDPIILNCENLSSVDSFPQINNKYSPKYLSELVRRLPFIISRNNKLSMVFVQL